MKKYGIFSGTYRKILVLDSMRILLGIVTVIMLFAFVAGIQQARAAAPGGEWWNSNYTLRNKITITAGSAAVPTDYSVSFTEDTATLITNSKVLSDGKDWRIAYWNGSIWVELDRWVDDIIGDGWNSANTVSWFKTQAAISASSSDDNYYFYYGYSGETQSPPASMSDSMGADATASKVFWYADDFEEHGASTDPDGWTDHGVEDYQVALHGSEKWLQAQTRTAWDDGSTASSMANIGDAVWSSKIYYHQYTSGALGWGGIGVHVGNGNVGYIVLVEDGAWYRADELWGNATGWQADGNIHLPIGTKGRIELVTYGTTLDAYWYNPAGYSPEKVTIFTGFTMPAGTGKLDVYVERPDGATNDRWVDEDDVIVRQYVSPEPTTSLGTETSGGGGNTPPTVNAGTNKTITLPDTDEVIDDATASDPDSGPSSLVITWSQVSGPATVTFTPDDDPFTTVSGLTLAGDYVLKLSAYDGADTTEDTVTITVNSTGGGVGIPITAGDVAGYSCNMKITIDNTKVAFTSSEIFPVLISLTDDSLKTSACGFVTDPDGDDIIFTNSNLTLQLYHEIEKYDETTGEIVAWVLVPSLSGTTDTDIYMYFGNSSVTSPTESPADVWDADYAGVWHLKEDAATGAPATWEDRIATHEDDSEETISSGYIDWGSSDLELGEEGSAQIVGMRWRNITIPQGATITSAYIEFTADEVQTGTPVNLTFWGEDVDNAAVFQDAAYNISSTHYNNKTSASVAWNNVPTWPTVGATHQSPDISPIIQEIVNRGGWTSGNALVVLVTGSGRRTADSYSEPTKAPLLHVEYSTATDLHLDSTSNDNDGIPNGNSLTASGKIDGAQDFDGTNDWIKVPHSSSLNLTGDVTMEFWMKYDTWQTWDFMVGKGDDASSDINYGVQFWDVSNRYGSDYTNSSNNWCGGSANSTVSSGTWYHISVTYNDSTNEVRFYRNGQADGTDSGCDADTSTVALGIGADGLGQRSFDGVLDEVRISSTVRSAEWIQTSYNNQNDPSSFYSVEKNCPSTIPPIAEFTCSIPLTIDSSRVSGTSDLIDFPVLISLTNTSLRNTGSCGYVQNSNGYDIIFSDATQTTILDHEIEKYDGASGELVAWVRVPTLKYNEDTVINIHYGHSSVCGATENPTGVWDSNYKGVWHLGDTSGDTQDSTSHNTDGNLSGTVTRGATGQIGDAFDFYTNGEVDWGNPSDDHLDADTGNWTVSLWANIDNNRGSGMWEKIINKGKGSWETGYEMELDDTANNLYFSINDGSTEWGESTSMSFTEDTWMYVVGVVDRTTKYLRLYKDGAQVGTNYIGDYGNIDVSDSLTIGKSTWGWPDARIDEVRLSNTARSAEWIETSYNNQSNPSSFYSLGSSSCFLAGFSCNRKITIDSSKVEGSSDLTNFPFLIKIQNDCNLKTAANGGGVQNSSGWDIIFVDSDGITQLDHEVEEYDGTTGDLTAWIKIPTLPYNSDKDIYMYYGKSGLTCDPSNPTGVWDSSYEAVYHLNGNVDDSTSNNRDGYNNNTGDVSGVIENGRNFSPVDDFDIGTWAVSGQGLTLQAWVDFDDFDQDDPRVIDKASGSSADYHVFMLGLGDTGDAVEHHPRFRVKTNYNDTTAGSTTTLLASGYDMNTSWHLLAGTYDGSNMRLLVDGNQVASTAKTGDLGVNSWDITVGNQPGGSSSTTYSMDGKLDEVRVLSVARSANWLRTEYNNQNDPASFFTMTEDTCGGTYGFNFQYCKKITVDHTQVSGDLTRYPLLINITGDDDLKTVANGGRIQNSQGWDIVFRTEGCGNYDHEIEKYDGVNGDLVAWVQIPTLSSSTDTEIYMYYGATVICDTSNPTAVWDARFRGVYHLNDDFEDSTQYNHDGTNNGATFTPGKIGSGALFDPSDGWDYIDLGTWSMSTADITLQAWVRPNDFNQNDPRVVTKCSTSGSSAQDHVYMLSLYNGDNGENRMRFRVKTGTDDLLNTVELFGTSPNGYLPTAQSWYFLAGTYENDNAAGTEMRMLRDEGLDAGQVGHAGSLRENSWPVWIGASPHGTNNSDRAWDGILDEVRILSSDLSQAWLETEYRNHNDPGNFYTITSCFEQTTEVTQEWVEEVQ